MLSYIKRGNGKVGYVTTEYTISADYKIKVKIKIAKERESETIETKEASLTREERKMITTFEESLAKKQKPFMDEHVQQYEDFEMRYNKDVIRDPDLQQQLRLIIDLIEMGHDEIKSEKLASLYEESCQRLYQKRFSEECIGKDKEDMI